MIKERGDDESWRAETIPELTDIDRSQVWKHLNLSENAYELYTNEMLLKDILTNSRCCKEYG